MIWDTIIAGFGGQGLLFAGRVLAQAAMLEGLEVTWLPSYGPQMRGGTANCAVIVSDQTIYSPLVKHPRGLIALNRPSLDEFGRLVRRGGLIVVNSSLADDAPLSLEPITIAVPASEIALRLGSVRVANMVALGAYLGSAHLLSERSIHAALEKAFPASRAELYNLNMAALREGAAYGEATRHPLQIGHAYGVARSNHRALWTGEDSDVCEE
jgi:2-oxoglutarate ferredoxin oxidoreductase subunit gamma